MRVNEFMTAPPDPTLLSLSEKDALITALLAQVQAQAEQIAVLTARVAELEAKLSLPPKTPDNSSTPPSRGQKANGDGKARAKSKAHAGAHRPLHPNPTRRAGRAVPALPRRRDGRGPGGGAGLRPHRDPPGGDAGDAARRRLPVLRQALQGLPAGRAGAGLAVRSQPARLRAVPAFRAGHPVRASRATDA